MAFRDLREFVSFLENKGQLKHIKTPVSPELEITEITDRASKSGSCNLALLFENVTGYDLPVLTNAFGSPQRMAWALGLEDLQELTERVKSLTSPDLPPSLAGKAKKGLQLLELARYTPRMVKDAPCQEVVLQGDEASLDRLPILKCWPEDGGPFITLPVVITHNPVSGKRNVGMYRMQVYDSHTTGMHWHLHKGGAAHYRESKGLGKRLEVAVAIGPDPATTYSATAPLPPDVDEFLFAGWLRRQRLELVRAKTVDLAVPARAEIVLEGYVNSDEARLEGPFGDHTGYYSLADMYPVFHLTAITHRRHPIYPATVVGKPPMEDFYLGKATERLFLPLIQLLLPEVLDLNLPAEGVFHNLAILSIRKTYPGQARRVMCGLWGMGYLMFSKYIVVVDDDVNVHDLSEVLWRLGNNVDPRRDVTIVEGPLDALDHSSPLAHYGAKMGLDATRKLPAEGHPREWPRDIKMSPEIKRLVDEKWAALGLG